MSLKTLLCAGALALAACASPIEPKTVDAPAMLVRPPLPTTRPSRIAFASAFLTENDAYSEIYVMNPDGTGIVPLEWMANVWYDGQPALSPDGSKIAFTSKRDGRAEIYVINATGSGIVRLTKSGATQPAWSPDGSQIAFTSLPVGGIADVYVMNADGSAILCSAGANAPSLRQSCQLTANAGYNGEPAWAPDGSKIAFKHLSSSVNPSDGGIYVMNATNGSVIARLTTTIWSGHPAWSPDGSRIAFHRGFRESTEICVMNATDGRIIAQLTNDTTYDGEPTWSPDGTQIAFTRGIDDGREIYVMNATDGSGKVRLTTNRFVDRAPSWAWASLTSR